MLPPETLRGYLSNSWVGDLQHLATLSGVQINTLQSIDAGRSVPSLDHIVAIRRIIDVPDEVLMRHQRPEPVVQRTRRGTVPEGYQLLLVELPELAVGDLIVISQPTAGRGNLWATVDSVQFQGHVYSVVVGGVSTLLSAESTLRVARRIS